MEALIVIFLGLVLLFLTGMPIAFAFFVLNIIGAFVFWGPQAGIPTLIDGIFGSLGRFSIFAVIMFILMGEILFHSGSAVKLLDVVDTWLGKLPGRLSLVSVAMGVILATLTGATASSNAILGELLVPEMEKRGYKRPMSLGPIMASGGLAVMIPPSSTAVLLAAIGGISAAGVLIGGILPGLLMATCYATYVIARCAIDPSIAPPYDVAPVSLGTKLLLAAKYVLPLGIVIFLVTGIIFLGVATPSEAAATGAVGSVILAAAYGKLRWEVLKKSLLGTLRLTAMVFLILAGATIFSRILAFSGATQGLIALAGDYQATPILIVAGMIVIGLILGCFMDSSSIIMLTLPIFMPILQAAGANPVWFGVLWLLVMETAALTPPVGIALFVMKAVAPRDVTMGQVYRAALPFFFINLVVIALILAFPPIATSLPSLMRR